MDDELQKAFDEYNEALEKAGALMGDAIDHLDKRVEQVLSQAKEVTKLAKEIREA